MGAPDIRNGSIVHYKPQSSATSTRYTGIATCTRVNESHLKNIPIYMDSAPFMWILISAGNQGKIEGEWLDNNTMIVGLLSQTYSIIFRINNYNELSGCKGLQLDKFVDLHESILHQCMYMYMLHESVLHLSHRIKYSFRALTEIIS